MHSMTDDRRHQESEKSFVIRQTIVVPQLSQNAQAKREKRPATHEAEKQWQKEIEMTKNTAWASEQCAFRINLTTEIEDDFCSSVFVVVVVAVIVQDEQCQQSQDLSIHRA